MKKPINMKLLMPLEKHGISYSVYYFSCNLEHVLHNEQNVPDLQKKEYAEAFEDKYVESPQEFITFLKSDEISVTGSYLETWNFIKDGINSLNRYSNLWLFFEQF